MPNPPAFGRQSHGIRAANPMTSGQSPHDIRAEPGTLKTSINAPGKMSRWACRMFGAGRPRKANNCRLACLLEIRVMLADVAFHKLGEFLCLSGFRVFTGLSERFDDLPVQFIGLANEPLLFLILCGSCRSRRSQNDFLLTACQTRSEVLIPPEQVRRSRTAHEVYPIFATDVSARAIGNTLYYQSPSGSCQELFAVPWGRPGRRDGPRSSMR